MTLSDYEKLRQKRIERNTERLSDYEKLRLERIKRNALRLKELGLDENLFKKVKPKKKKTASKVKRVKPGQERKSKRLSSKGNDDDLVMLDYSAKDGEEKIARQNGNADYVPMGYKVRKLFEDGNYYEGEVVSEPSMVLDEEKGKEVRCWKVKYLDDDEEELNFDELDRWGVEKAFTVQRRARPKRSNIDAEKLKLSEKDRKSLAALAGSADGNFLAKFEEFLEFENRISEQNKRSVMRQVRKLASGEGIRYESPNYGWEEGCYFKKGEKITPMSDIVQLMIEGQECEDKWGRDHGNGWLIAHPLKKLLLFQQFILNNPDFLTSELRLKDYWV